MAITVLLNTAGEKVTLNAEPKDVTTESGTLIVRRDRQIIARFRRHIAWFEAADNDTTETTD